MIYGLDTGFLVAAEVREQSLPQPTVRQGSNRSSPPTGQTSWFSASLLASHLAAAARIPE